MRLRRFNVSGFRSLISVDGIPVGEPTILAGHNDGGKTAAIDAICFLLGRYKLADEDRSYLRDSGNDRVARCHSTEVHGFFELDPWEQEQFNRPSMVEIRRRAPANGNPTVFEILTDVHEDEDLWDLSKALLDDLKALVKKHNLQTTGHLKDELRTSLEGYARANASVKAWVPVSRDIKSRLPEVLLFGGAAEVPDDAVKTALTSRFHEYLSDPETKGRISEIERDIQDRLRNDAEALCKHIQARCSDLGQVSVDPRVSLREGFSGAPLRIERSTGQPIGLDRSGLGNRRRISLAVWEWTCQLLREDETYRQSTESDDSSSGQGGAPSDAPPPLTQTIVIYDEPDTHLDYRHQRKIMQLVREQSSLQHVNVVVATHSMNLIDGVDIADVINLKLSDGQTVVERLEEDSHAQLDGHLGKIAASLGLRNSVLLHERVFLAVEGDSEYRTFPLLFRISEGLSLQSAGIALWACGGNDGALNLAKYLASHGRDVVLAIDEDSKSKKMFKEGRLADTFGPNWTQSVEFIGQDEYRREFEAIFAGATWASVANDLWPQMNGELWVDSDFENLHADGKKFSVEVEKLLAERSEEFRSGKPSMMADLAAHITDPADVPQSLRTLFTRLRQMAN